jgi:hypothetical protein
MPTNEYHCIGRGGCGSVWALPITTTTTTPSDNEARALQLSQILQRPHVLKRADGDTERSVANDMAMHRRFLHSTGSVHLPFLVPHSYRMLQAHNREYPDNLPAGRTPCETYLQERIPPLPLSIRSTLIHHYCPPSKRDSVRNSKNDEDCLVRLYSGKRRSAYDQTRHKSFFTLRNYGLYIDQMEDLGIDIDRAVAVLAKALANCYWVAHIDANDSEWVFGLPRSSSATTTPSPLKPAAGERSEEVVLNTQSEDKEMFTMRLDDGSKSEDMAVWMLGFDCVRPMSMDAAGVQQAIDAFYRNDPYFSRPWANEYTSEDARVWNVFKRAFVQESDGILTTEEAVVAARGTDVECGRDLAWLWVEGVEREGRRRMIEQAEKDGKEKARRMVAELDAILEAHQELVQN